jgi:hypothetical protein
MIESFPTDISFEKKLLRKEKKLQTPFFRFDIFPVGRLAALINRESKTS